MASAETEKHEMAQLERVNADLKESLKRCRRIVTDCHSRLAANSNTEDEETERDRRESR